MNHNEMVSWLIGNCECWKGQNDKNILNQLPDEKLEQLVEDAQRSAGALAVANRATRGFADKNGNAYRINPETGEWEHRQIGAGGTTGTGKNPAPAFNKGKKVKNEDPDDDDDDMDEEDYEEDEDEEAENDKKGKKSTRNSYGRRPRTDEEILNSLPEHFRRQIANADSVIQREKEKVVEQLLVNMNGPDKRAHRERLMRRDLEDLTTDLKLFKQQLQFGEERVQESDYARNSGGRQVPTEDMLTIPSTFNWDGKGEGGGATANAGSGVGDDGQHSGMGGQGGGVASPAYNQQHGGDMETEDWLRKAPPHVQARINNIMAIEAREKRELINRIVSNSDLDGSGEKRMRKRLETLDLDGLRDFAEGFSQREQRRPNYGGAAGGPSTTNRQAQSDDVLPLPSMDWSSGNVKQA